MSIVEMLFGAQLNPPADENLINYVQIDLGIMGKLYLDLVRMSNGGVFGGQYVLYQVQSLAERNAAFEAEIYIPSYILIGDDSGGQGIAIRRGDTHSAVFFANHSVMQINSESQFEDLHSFLRFANGLMPNADSLDTAPNLVDVYLVRSPIGGAKDLLKIKDRLGLQTSIAELKKGVEKLPLLLLEGVPYGKYRIRCEELNAIDPCLALTSVGLPDEVI